jgi:aryl-alcohol dehydrogenase-like predicted oxidoreductase
MSNIGLGTAAIGRPQYINIKQEESEAFDQPKFIEKGRQVLESAYMQGIRYFDTAPGYGLAEQLLLDWVKEKKDLNIEVASKWGYAYVANFDPKAKIHEVKDHSISQLNEQWERTKELLPYLSTLQIHSATFDTGVLDNKEVLEKLAQLKSEYNILIGLTTTGHNQIDIIKHALNIEIEGMQLFDAFQVTYNILDQSLSGITDLLKHLNKRVIVKEALANGRIFKNEQYAHYGSLYKCLGQMAEKYNVGVDAIALKFCNQSINPYNVLSGASLPLQISDNLKSLSFEIEEEDLLELKSFSIAPKHYWTERKRLSWN